MVLLDRSSTAFGWFLFRVEHERLRRRVPHHQRCAEGECLRHREAGAARDDARLSAQHLLWNAPLVDAVGLQLLRGRQSFAWLELAAAHTSIASTASPAALFLGCSAPDLLGRASFQARSRRTPAWSRLTSRARATTAPCPRSRRHAPSVRSAARRRCTGPRSEQRGPLRAHARSRRTPSSARR